MLTFDVQLDLIFSIPDRAINVEVNIEDNQVPKCQCTQMISQSLMKKIKLIRHQPQDSMLKENKIRHMVKWRGELDYSTSCQNEEFDFSIQGFG